MIFPPKYVLPLEARRTPPKYVLPLEARRAPSAFVPMEAQ
ncbi:hypothetical protein LY15_001937 [Prauserella flava]|uniref:Uncharacterized protein n=1 Tax=Prauserella sediminis TaxID=577680 RepID=A0A839XG45_9PSEU|nr:hypothetical protein [Prauserella sediminis]MCR3719963.1 hypothetical protein [Prauserella flava]MCR3736493.1 hypothetical protein [Prauserella salsuginis]